MHVNLTRASVGLPLSRLPTRVLIQQAKKKSGLLTKMGSHPPDLRRPIYNNRKGSRHRLTPQAKEILEGWLAKHWLNPYPTEDEKVYLAQACLITVTQVRGGGRRRVY